MWRQPAAVASAAGGSGGAAASSSSEQQQRAAVRSSKPSAPGHQRQSTKPAETWPAVDPHKGIQKAVANRRCTEEMAKEEKRKIRGIINRLFCSWQQPTAAASSSKQRRRATASSSEQQQRAIASSGSEQQQAAAASSSKQRHAFGSRSSATGYQGSRGPADGCCPQEH